MNTHKEQFKKGERVRVVEYGEDMGEGAVTVTDYSSDVFQVEVRLDKTGVAEWFRDIHVAPLEPKEEEYARISAPWDSLDKKLVEPTPPSQIEEERLEYMMVNLNDYEIFIEKVQKLMDSGWKLQGGVSITKIGASVISADNPSLGLNQNFSYCQALVRVDNTK